MQAVLEVWQVLEEKEPDKSVQEGYCQNRCESVKVVDQGNISQCLSVRKKQIVCLLGCWHKVATGDVAHWETLLANSHDQLLVWDLDAAADFAHACLEPVSFASFISSLSDHVVDRTVDKLDNGARQHDDRSPGYATHMVYQRVADRSPESSETFLSLEVVLADDSCVHVVSQVVDEQEQPEPRDDQENNRDPVVPRDGVDLVGIASGSVLVNSTRGVAADDEENTNQEQHNL